MGENERRWSGGYSREGTWTYVSNVETLRSQGRSLPLPVAGALKVSRVISQTSCSPLSFFLPSFLSFANLLTCVTTALSRNNYELSRSLPPVCHTERSDKNNPTKSLDLSLFLSTPSHNSFSLSVSVQHFYRWNFRTHNIGNFNKI